MRAGRQRHQVYIDRPVDTLDLNNDPVRTWEQVGQFWWAAVEPLTAREFANGTATLGIMDTRFIFRWSQTFEEVTERYRIRFRSKVFNIVSVAERRSERREMEVMAKTGANEG